MVSVSPLWLARSGVQHELKCCGNSFLEGFPSKRMNIAKPKGYRMKWAARTAGMDQPNQLSVGIERKSARTIWTHSVGLAS